MEAVPSNLFSGNIEFVKQEFALTEKEAQHLSKTIKGYSGEKSFQHFLYRLKNVIKGIFLRSDWQVAKRHLNHTALNVLQRRSGHSVTDIAKAKQLSEFVLRYLVTAQPVEKPKFYIPKKIWGSDLFLQARLYGNLNEKTFTNLIVGDLYGDAPPTTAACLKLVSDRLKISVDFFKDKISEIKDPLKKDIVQKTIQQLEQGGGLTLDEAFKYAHNFSGVDLKSKVSES